MRFYNQFLVFFLNGCLQLADNLVSNVVDVSTSLGCTNAVDEGDLLELAVTETGNDLPPFGLFLNDFGEVHVLLIVQVKVTVVNEVLNLDPFTIKHHFYF